MSEKTDVIETNGKSTKQQPEDDNSAIASEKSNGNSTSNGKIEPLLLTENAESIQKDAETKASPPNGNPPTNGNPPNGNSSNGNPPPNNNDNPYKPGVIARNADDLANLCAALFVLAIGCGLFFVAYNILLPESMVLDWFNKIVITLIGGLIILSFAGMKFFQRRYDEYVKYLKENHHYFLSWQRIQTLRSAKIPIDIIKCLNEIMTKSEQKNLSTQDEDHGWLLDLRNELDEARYDEYKAAIKKYTYCKVTSKTPPMVAAKTSTP